MAKKVARIKKDPKCADLVQSHFEGRIAVIRQLLEANNRGEESVEDLGSIYDYGLSFDYVSAGTFSDQDEGYFRYQISWGGPSDEFRFYADAQCNIHRVEYWYMDWFDGAHVVVTRDDGVRMLVDWFEGFDGFRGALAVATEE